jgi:hypothetical protein
MTLQDLGHYQRFFSAPSRNIYLISLASSKTLRLWSEIHVFLRRYLHWLPVQGAYLTQAILKVTCSARIGTAMTVNACALSLRY